MKTRLFLSCLAVVFFGILAGASVEEDGSLSGWFVLIIVVAVVAGILSAIHENAQKKEARQQASEEFRARQRRDAEKAEKYAQWLEKYIEQNGTPDKTIIVEANEVNGVIHVHEAKKAVFMNGAEYQFKDIMSCTYTDNPTTVKGKITSTTKSSTGSTVGRAIVGDLIAGPAGAIIGGTTGKKTTEYHQEDDKVYHDFTVIINVNSITNPIIRIDTGQDGKLTNEIVGLMNVIIARK